MRWGIAGPGRIANDLAPDFVHVAGAELVAVGSRSADRAAAFAARHGIERSYGSYRELLDDPDVDAVYIATPHPQHQAIALAALSAGKAVLVEKAFTATLAGAEQVVAAATEHGVFAMEAMWTRFQPAMVRLRELLADGAIGRVRGVQADLGILRDVDPADRLFAPELGGGALLDLGVYVVSFADMVLGPPDRVTAHGSIGSTGVEIDTALLLGYPDGASASLITSLHSAMPGQARVFGTAGWIDVLPRFHHPSQLVLHRPDVLPQTITEPPLGAGYAHELIEVTNCVRAGALQSATMSLSDTLAVQRVLDQAADQVGVPRAEDPAAL
ncbi:MAG: Gfo/Idh/MocA family oxidoreductase [Actinomycetota bacterium]